jgi:hypothetical protein
METVELAGRLGSDFGFEANQRGRAPASRSGAFVYRRGRYIPLSAIPGATFATLAVAINNRGETADTSVDAAPGNDGELPPGSVNVFVRNRGSDSTKFHGPRGGRVAVFRLTNRGQTTGTYVDAGAVPGPNGLLPPGAVHGFISDRNGRITTFDAPFTYVHAISDINDLGQTVGFYDTPQARAAASCASATERSRRSTSLGPAR